MTAWIATKPLTNTNAPLTPFDMPQYRSAATEEADAARGEGQRRARASQRNVERADRYALAVVLFATSLFFAGISGRLSDELSRRAVLVMGVRHVRRRRRLDGDVPLRRVAPPPNRTGFSPLPDDESVSGSLIIPPGRLDGCRSSLRHRRSPTPGGADCRYERGRVTALGSPAVDLARTQFALTSQHFLFVPLTLGLAPLVAVMQTLAPLRRRGVAATDEFFGTLMLINFAIGVATGLVQEFQFGMNWAVYSKFVGDVFEAPLAIEGLAAFMLEATFSGCGSSAGIACRRASPGDDLDRGARHGLSAYFILAANSWMQHRPAWSRRPRGADERVGHAMTAGWALWAFGHTMRAQDPG